MTKLKTVGIIGIIFLTGCAPKIAPSDTPAQAATSQTTSNTTNAPARSNGGTMLKSANGGNDMNRPAELTK